jgi:mannose-6-phosphate isomerase-like protein (cupin superfamily)
VRADVRRQIAPPEGRIPPTLNNISNKQACGQDSEPSEDQRRPRARYASRPHELLFLLPALHAARYETQLCSGGAQIERGMKMALDKVNLQQKFSLFSDQYSPKIAGELNDFYVKLVKFRGPFVWHHHAVEDELFFVVKGTMRMGVRENGVEREIVIGPGEFIIMPHGVEHCPSADEETQVMLLEPKSTLNTGNVESERTRHELQRI